MKHYTHFKNTRAVMLVAATLLASCGEEEAPKSAACDVVTFSVDGEAWTINGEEITFTYPPETVATPLSPVITLSPGATVDPPSGEEQDLFSPAGVAYTVTAEDGMTTKSYNARATITPLYSGTTGDCAWAITGPADNYTLTISGSGAMEDYGLTTSWPPESWVDIKTAVIRDGVTTIGDRAFMSSNHLTSVIIGDSARTIGLGAFLSCHNLTSVTIGNSVRSLDRYAFSDCDALTSVTLPNSVITIGDGAFYKCTGLTSVTIGNSVQTIGSVAFQNCDALTSVTIPESVITIGDGAFEFCAALTSVTIPNSVQTIGYGAFYQCTSMASATIGNAVQTIGTAAFYECSALTSLTIGNAVQTIGEGAFIHVGLTSVTIPASVTTIERWAFANCNKLTSVTNRATTPQAFYNADHNGIFDDIDLKAVTLKVPATAVDAYKAAPGWGAFGTVEAI